MCSARVANPNTAQTKPPIAARSRPPDGAPNAVPELFWFLITSGLEQNRSGKLAGHRFKFSIFNVLSLVSYRLLQTNTVPCWKDRNGLAGIFTCLIIQKSMLNLCSEGKYLPEKDGKVILKRVRNDFNLNPNVLGYFIFLMISRKKTIFGALLRTMSTSLLTCFKRYFMTNAE